MLTSLALGPGEAVDAGAAVGADAPSPVLAAVLTHSCQGKKENSIIPAPSGRLEELGVSEIGISAPCSPAEKSEIFIPFSAELFPVGARAPFC